jgi:3-hydroxyacyl-[acyl-carrier-protein] dehydratase
MLNRQEIEQLIPHRAPFLWVDEVVERTDRTIHARKFLDPKLDVFAGHFPDFPVLPGVSAGGSSAGIPFAGVPSADEALPVVTRLNNVKFRRMVRPGETLDIHAELTERLSSAYFLKARTAVGGQTSCSLEFACTFTQKKAL